MLSCPNKRNWSVWQGNNNLLCRYTFPRVCWISYTNYKLCTSQLKYLDVRNFNLWINYIYVNQFKKLCPEGKYQIIISQMRNFFKTSVLILSFLNGRDHVHVTGLLKTASFSHSFWHLELIMKLIFWQLWCLPDLLTYIPIFIPVYHCDIVN